MDSYLPNVNVTRGLRKGRNPYEGSQRGWGLQFGGLREQILADPLYQEALSPAHSRTIMAEMNRMNIYLILRFYLADLPPGQIVEYGSYMGGNAIFMAYVAKRLYPGMKVYALDTFEGMPPTEKAIDMHSAGDFRNVNLDSLRRHIDRLGLDNLILVQGLFNQTSPDVLRQAGKISLAHIDCDIASAVRYSYESVLPFLVPGAYMVFDDAAVSSCLGATEVVEDIVIRRDGRNSEQIWPQFVFRNLPPST